MAGSILTAMDEPLRIDGTSWRRAWRRAAAAIGGPCDVCRQWSARPFCGPCLRLYAPAVRRCPGCAAPTGTGGRCAACRPGGSPVERTVVAFDYAFPWDRAILDLKFKARTELARPLADALLRALLGTAADTRGEAIDALVPVPLAPDRLAERGYNQSLLIARHLADALQVPVAPHWLLRPVATAHQTGLPREQRERNLRGAFMIDPRQRESLAGRRVALVDDVVTTGATAREAARELLRGGARAVELWAVARTA